MVEVLMVQDESVSTEGPRAGGPRRRRVFTVAEKIQHLAAYVAACDAADGGGGANLREQSVYSCPDHRRGGSCTMPGYWPGSGRVRRSAGPVRSRPRLPG